MKPAMTNQISMYEKNPAGFSVRAYDETEKEKILAYMRSFDPYAVAGKVYDCITGEKTKEENVGFHDGLFTWSSQDIYHLELYDASITDDFMRMIIR